MRNPSGIIAGGPSASKTMTTPCCSKIGIKRGPWTPKEDEILSNYVKKEGEGRWSTLPKRAGLLRCGKSCRLRWMNYLHPSVKRGCIAPDEEDLILRLHRLLGNRWALIAGRIPGRTDNEIKNYWNTHLSKKLISQGIDPRTHKPLQNWNPDTKEYAVGTSSSIMIPNHDVQNVNPNSGGNDGATTAPAVVNPGILPSETRCENWENYLGNEQDDVLSSLLDSLMNDDEHTHLQLRDAAVISPPDFQVYSSLNPSLGDEVLWGEEAGFRSAMGEFKPADQQSNAVDDHHA